MTSKVFRNRANLEVAAQNLRRSVVPVENSQSSVIESAPERATRVRDFVERMIVTVREHPECELKREWKRNTPYLKAEFIKDIQSIANSAIVPGQEKYLVVGVDEVTKEIVGCNHGDYDDAEMVEVLERYLDPMPKVEVLHLLASNGKDIVVVRIPYQPQRPIVVRDSVRDNTRAYLEEGQIWLKPGAPGTASSGKRLLKAREELLSLIDIEPRVQSELNERVNQILPQIRLEERTRIQTQTISAVSALTMTDEEFEGYLVQVLTSGNEGHLNVLVEMLRDKTVEPWFERDDQARFSPEDIQRIKNTAFIPAMRRMTLLGLLLIKFSAPVEWFSKISSLLIEIFNASHALKSAVSHIDAYSRVASLDEQTGYTVPAVESLLSSQVLAGYEIQRDSNKYMGTFFSKVVQNVPGINHEPRRMLFMFWPTTHEGSPDLRRDLMAVERYATGDRIEKLFRGKEGIREAVMQADFLIEWHSFLSFQHNVAHTPEIAEYFDKNYKGVSTSYWPHFPFDKLALVQPFVDKLWSTIHSQGERNFWSVLPGLDEVFQKIDVPRRQQLLGKHLFDADATHRKAMFDSNRMPFRTYWPPEIAAVIKQIGESEAAKQRANS